MRPPPARPRARRRRWASALLITLLTLLITLTTLWLALTCRPAWYRPAAIDQARLRDDKHELVTLLDHIGAALNAGRSIRIELDAAQVNRWLTARREMWPDADIDLGPLRHPVLRFEPGGLRLAALADTGTFRTVLSARCHIALQDDRLALRCHAVRLGVLPVPSTWLQHPLADLLRSAADSPAPSGDGTSLLDNRWRWPNGKVPFRLDRVSFTADHATLELTPLPRAR